MEGDGDGMRSEVNERHTVDNDSDSLKGYQTRAKQNLVSEVKRKG